MVAYRPLVKIAAAALLITAGLSAGAGQEGRKEALASLIAAERSFSRTSEAKGIREAFLTFLASDAVVFRPGPVEGRPVYEKMDPANPGLLTWEPEVAEVSAAGDLGYTSGPYVYRQSRDAEPASYGDYVSVWKKQADGTWKVFLDIGIRHGRPEAPARPGEVDMPAVGKNAGPLSPERLRDEERAFGPRAGLIESIAAAKGLRKALSELSTDDVRVYRPEKFPTIGKAAFKELIPANAGRIDPRTQRHTGDHQIGIAWSGDLAYSYGTSRLSKDPTTSERTAFLRIWRKERSGVWKICLDIEFPLPAEAEKKD
jgi:ketosteroid isomerase-like protein